MRKHDLMALRFNSTMTNFLADWNAHQRQMAERRLADDDRQRAQDAAMIEGELIARGQSWYTGLNHDGRFEYLANIFGPAEDDEQRREAVARWYIAGFAFIPSHEDFDFVRESWARDMVYTAEQNHRWTVERLDQAMRDMRVILGRGAIDEPGIGADRAPAHPDLSDLDIQRIERQVELIERLEFQAGRWQLLKDAIDGVCNIGGFDFRGVTRDRYARAVKTWALGFRDALDASEGLCDFLHERVLWAMSNMAHRNIQFCRKHHRGSNSARHANRMELQERFWICWGEAVQAAYREVTGEVFMPAYDDDLNATDPREAALALARFTIARIEGPGSTSQASSAHSKMRRRA